MGSSGVTFSGLGDVYAYRGFGLFELDGYIYIAIDTVLYRAAITGGAITSYKTGLPSSAKLSGSNGLLYWASDNNNTVTIINASTAAIIATLNGYNDGSDHSFTGIASCDSDGTNYYIFDKYNTCKIYVSNGYVADKFTVIESFGTLTEGATWGGAGTFRSESGRSHFSKIVKSGDDLFVSDIWTTSNAEDVVQKFSLPALPPLDPTLLTVTCVAGIGETAVPDAPVASLSADVTSGLAPLTVQFTDLSGNNPTSWLWEFGDGGISTSQDPSHVFSAGIWTVRLTATNDQGSSSYVMTIIASSTPVFTPPEGGTVTPGGSIPGETIAGLIGKIGYYAVDTLNNEVLIYTANGTLLKTFGGIGNTSGKFWSPTTCSVINGRQLLDRVVIEQE